MVEDPSDYIWSSYKINALGKTSDLCTPHPEYLRLGDRAIALKLPALKNLDQVIVNPPSSQAFGLQPTFE